MSGMRCGGKQAPPLSAKPCGCVLDSRVAVRQLVIALVRLHGELQVALLTCEACLVPHLQKYTNKQINK